MSFKPGDLVYALPSSENYYSITSHGAAFFGLVVWSRSSVLHPGHDLGVVSLFSLEQRPERCLLNNLSTKHLAEAVNTFRANPFDHPSSFFSAFHATEHIPSLQEHEDVSLPVFQVESDHFSLVSSPDFFRCYNWNALNPEQTQKMKQAFFYPDTSHTLFPHILL